VEAFKKIVARTGILQTPTWQIILAKCLRDWTDDFQMANYCEEQQVAAAGPLGVAATTALAPPPADDGPSLDAVKAWLESDGTALLAERRFASASANASGSHSDSASDLRSGAGVVRHGQVLQPGRLHQELQDQLEPVRGLRRVRKGNSAPALSGRPEGARRADEGSGEVTAIETMWKLQIELNALKAAVRTETISTINRKDLRLEAERLGSKWFQEIRPLVNGTAVALPTPWSGTRRGSSGS
jgi:hypothetical protein